MQKEIAIPRAYYCLQSQPQANFLFRFVLFMSITVKHEVVVFCQHIHIWSQYSIFTLANMYAMQIEAITLYKTIFILQNMLT